MKQALRVLLLFAAAGVAFFALIQFIPVNHTNPPITTRVNWDSAQTQVLFKRACADCHSNETLWPWYSYVAPVSWLVAHDVGEGRERFNISNLNTGSARYNRTVSEISRSIESGRMPMGIYLIMHPSAHLTAQESQALINGLQTTLSGTQTSSIQAGGDYGFLYLLPFR